MYIVSALYHFVLLEDFERLQAPILSKMKENGILGSLLLAREGINGTISGKPEDMSRFLSFLREDPRFAKIHIKDSCHEKPPFERTKVKLKKEIVTMGVEDINPNIHAGTYIKPKDWNAFISLPNVAVFDVRNDYEVSIGTFSGAINPETNTFREFPEFVDEHLAGLPKDQKIAMYCTGGIRCEKSTAYLKQRGFTEVYHLEGGILKYLEEVPEAESLWEGECFVFDERVSVKHGLGKGQYDQCYACRMPITEEDKQQDTYVKGISCLHCHGTKEAAQQARYAERQKQITLAAKRGQKHVGGSMQALIKQNREAKYTSKE
jgi:UPF0176 protein